MSVIQRIDQKKAAAFEERFVESLNAASMCLMASIGHQTGLFDAMAEMPAGTVDEIAEKSALNARYVREWLGAMTVSGVVEHDPVSETFRLPVEHAGYLTRAAAPENLAVYAQYIPLLGGVEADIIACFKNGGGVAYEKYTRFHEVMAEDSGQTVLPALLDHILPLMGGITERLADGIRVLDVGCGRGRALMLMAETYPNSRFTGYDLSEQAVTYARQQAQQKGLSNVVFEARDLTTFDQEATPDQFDLITTFDAVHDQADPAAVLAGIHTALVEDGVYLAQDIKGHSHVHGNLDHPIGPLLYTISCMHCMTVSLAQGGSGLGAMWGQELAVQMFGDAGFRQVETHELEHDFQNNYYVCRK